MAFVLDCSVAMAWVFPDVATESTGRLRDSLIDGRAFVPSLWPVEVASVLLAATRRGCLGAEEWPRVCASLEADRSGLHVAHGGSGARSRRGAPPVRLRRHVSGACSPDAAAARHIGPCARRRGTSRGCGHAGDHVAHTRTERRIRNRAGPEAVRISNRQHLFALLVRTGTWQSYGERREVDVDAGESEQLGVVEGAGDAVRGAA